jgi:preprotein translocase subunit SecG
MVSFMIVLHIIVCFLLIISILMQASKGGGLTGMFGGGGSMGGVFGGRGASSFLSKVSLWLGIAFGVTSISIGLLSLKSGSRPKSVIQDAIGREETVTPASVLPTVPGKTDNASDQGAKQSPEKPKTK